MSEFNLDDFLAAQSAQGEAQGESGFTISHSKAAQKMAQFSLPRSHSWALKIIQAAVGWNCEKVRVEQTRTVSLFHLAFPNPSGVPTNQELIEAILRLNFESTKPLDCMATALRVLVERSHLSFQLLFHDGSEQEQEAIYAGVYFSELGDSRRAALRRQWEAGVTIAIQHVAHSETNRLILNRVPIHRYSLPVLTELERYAYTSPVPITVDGRRIDGLFRSCTPGWSYRVKPLMVRGLGEEDGLLAVADDFGDRTSTLHESLEKIRTERPPFRKRDAYLAIALEEPVANDDPAGFRCKVTWVKNGVVAQESDYNFVTRYLRCHLFFCADDLDTDLTGFQLIENEKFFQRRLDATTQVLRALSEELKESRNIIGSPAEKPTALLTLRKPEDRELLKTRLSPILKSLRKGKGLSSILEAIELSKRFGQDMLHYIDWENRWSASRFPEELSEFSGLMEQQVSLDFESLEEASLGD